MTPKAFSLATPFIVLAIVVASFTATPLWIQRRGAQLREPASLALTSSVGATAHLVDMRVQLHRYLATVDSDGSEGLQEAWSRVDQSFAAYAAEFPSAASGLVNALADLERDVDAGVSPRQVQKSGERLTEMLMGSVAEGARRAGAASTTLERVRSQALEMVNKLNSIWALVAALGGLVAALLVRKHQRVAAQVRRLQEERAGELEQFSARVAHEIVGPLAPVSVGVEVLARKMKTDDQAQQAAASIRRSVNRVAIIVDELLRFARAGGQPAPGESADLRPIMHQLREELIPVAEERGISLTFEPPPPVRVACAEGAILVVLQNLIRNSIKYIGNGPHKTIVAKAAVMADAIRLSFYDSGPGIPAGMQQAVFEPYVRAPDTRQPGIGLGLATVKRIVESRRGRVGVWSEPRRGATFWVDLPIAAQT
jgi:signal transduction histidine kinase